MSLECAEQVYRHLRMLTASGGPYAAIYDLSIVKGTTIPTDVVRGLARRKPSIPTETGRPIVVVGTFPVIYGLARLFQMCGESVDSKFDVVHTMKEAYAIVQVRPEDFTEHLFQMDLAA